MKAVLLVSHGSQSSKTEREIAALTEKLRQRSDIKIFEYAFLEIQKPDIPQGLDLCVKKGATEIIVLLNFLNSGKHVDQDIPRIIHAAREKYPHISISQTKPIGQHEKIVDLFLNLLE